MHRKGFRRTTQDTGVDASASRLTNDQISRLAEMVTDGRCELPDDLPTTDHQRFQAEVQRRLRQRLIRLIARAIALHLRRDAGSHSETTDHA